MKRSPIARKTPLGRSRPRRPVEPGRDVFKTRVLHGACTVCGREGMLLRHHVILEQHLRALGADPWALANGMWVGVDGLTCNCHALHHGAFRRIPLDKVPDAAIDFARQLLGDDKAALYFARFYSPPEGGNT
jgi:hypothetical protein